MRSIAFGLLSISLGSTLALAQQVGTLEFARHEHGWPVGAASESATLAVAGRLTGVVSRDVVTVIVVADAGGLSVGVHGGATGFYFVPLAVSGFAGAKSLHATDVTADGHEDLVAVDGTGRYVRLLEGASYGHGPSRSHDFGAIANLTAVTVARLAAAPTSPTIVAAVGTTLAGLDPSFVGVPANLASSNEPTIALVTLRGAGSTDQVAWLTGTSSGATLRVLTGSTVATLALPGRDFVSMTSGDVDDDGDADLVLSQRNNHRVLQLRNGPSGFSLSLGTAYEIPLIDEADNAAPENAATPVLVDIDDDGDLDLVHAVQSVEQLVVCIDDFIDGSADTVPLTGIWLDTSGTSDRLVLAYDVLNLCEDATHIEVSAWKLKDTSSGMVVDTSFVGLTWYFTTLDGNLPLDLSESSVLEFGDVYLVLVRAGRVDAGEFTWFPPRVLLVTGVDEVFDWLKIEFPYFLSAEATDVGDGGESAGGYLDLPLPILIPGPIQVGN
jgi:hypothetical protein